MRLKTPGTQDSGDSGSGGRSGSQSRRIVVIGAGYVGLTTAACFAHLGHRVICTDIDLSRVARLRRADLPIHEPELTEMVRAGLAEGSLRFEHGSAGAVPDADFVYLCVPTPQLADGSADLGHVAAAAAEIGPHLDPGTVVVSKSTVPVGSAGFVERALGRADVAVVSNPEFLREGSAVGDCLHPDRVVIGAEDRTAADRVADLYRSRATVILITDPASAETTKYAANAYLATRLSFVNALAAVCETLDADIDDVLAGLSHDHRIGSHFLQPGPGWGGSCLPKDTQALISMADQAGYDFSLLKGVVDVNTQQFNRIVGKVGEQLALDGASLDGAVIAMWGIAFKANTDDIRRSPALEIAARLLNAGAEVRAYDPAIAATGPAEAAFAEAALAGLSLVADPYEACRDAQALVVATEWAEFRELDLDRVAELMAQRHVIDARNLLDRAALLQRGFSYRGVGRN